MSENTKPEQNGPQFVLQRIYTKDISFETPNSPAIFSAEWKPESNLNMNSEVNTLEDDHYEVVLTITVTTKGTDANSGDAIAGVDTTIVTQQAKAHLKVASVSPSNNYR